MPEDLVTERMCQERHRNYTEAVNRLERKIDSIHSLLIGNGKLGYFGKIDVLWSVTAFLVVTIVGRMIFWLISFLPKG